MNYGTKGRKNKAIFFSLGIFLTLIPLINHFLMRRLNLPAWGRTAIALAGIIFMGIAAKAQGPHFSHQTIFVTDLDRAAIFYEKVLQLKKIE